MENLNINLLTIPYRKTNAFNKLVLDYLDKISFLKQFIQDFPTIHSFHEEIKAKQSEFTFRNQLHNLLVEQYASLNTNDLVRKNIDAFKNDSTFCVVTAHQLNIFTGPLYVIYKTITTIKLCKQLKEKYPNYHFVPVFWLGSEDHDLEEINHIHLYSKKISWQTHQTGATGRMDTKSLSTVLDEISNILGNKEEAEKIIQLFSDAYTTGENLAGSARIYLNTLFEHEGLIVIDGDHHTLKTECISIIRDEIINKSAQTIVQQTIKQFENDYPIQAAPREINLFYLSENSRNRIVFNQEKEQFDLANHNKTFSKVAIIEELENFPERFSPNVILRPLFQQKVLPSVAFVGGGGEISYWLQLKTLFQYHQIHFPLLILRDSFLIIDKNTNSKLKKLGIETEKIFLNEHEIIKQYVDQNHTMNFNFEQYKSQISADFEKMSKESKQIDVNLEKMILAERQSVIATLEKIESKVLKSQKQKSETTIQQISNIKSKLFPENILQERYDNFIPYFLKFGPTFIQELIEKSDPLNPSFKILIEESTF